MTEHHDDDINLVNFLRQNRPQIPPASPELEEKILQQVSQYQEKTGNSKRENVTSISRFKRRFLYLFPSAIAAGIVIFISSYRLLTPQQPSEVELSKIEAFMENNWHDALSERPEVSSFLDD
jgi:hypothetical protein